jgi:hypothetical protein
VGLPQLAEVAMGEGGSLPVTSGNLNSLKSMTNGLYKFWKQGITEWKS